MNRALIAGLVVALFSLGTVAAQQQNQSGSTLDINGSSASGSPPYSATVNVPGPISFTVSGNSNMPFLIVQGLMADVGNMVFPSIGQIDVGPVPAVAFDGYAMPITPVPGTNPAQLANTGGTGSMTYDFCVPSNTAPAAPFFAWQAIVIDFTNPPYYSTLSAATVVDVTATGNLPPLSDAGADQTVVTGCAVTLDGSASMDPEMNPISYAWTQLSGATVMLTGSTTANPTFTAPTSPDVLVFELVASDTQAGCPDTVTVTVNAATAPFASSVDGIWGNRGCTGCHGSLGGLTLSGSASANWQELMDPANAAGMRVDLGAPASSLILTKPLGVSHGGGTFFSSTADPDYQTILSWIQEGACFN